MTSKAWKNTAVRQEREKSKGDNNTALGREDDTMVREKRRRWQRGDNNNRQNVARNKDDDNNREEDNWIENVKARRGKSKAKRKKQQQLDGKKTTQGRMTKRWEWKKTTWRKKSDHKSGKILWQL